MSLPTPPPVTLACPTCQQRVVWSDAFPHRPFCSERCRLIDLGAWAAADYAIPADSPPDGQLDEPL